MISTMFSTQTASFVSLTMVLSCTAPRSTVDVLQDAVQGTAPQWQDGNRFTVKSWCMAPEKLEQPFTNTSLSNREIFHFSKEGAAIYAVGRAIPWWLRNTSDGKQCDPESAPFLKQHGVKTVQIHLCGPLPEPVGHEACPAVESTFDDTVRAIFVIKAAKLVFRCNNAFFPLIHPDGSLVDGKGMIGPRLCPKGTQYVHRISQWTIEPPKPSYYLPPK